MKKILVATDFSPAALNAAKYAADMAMVVNADLYLLYVNQIVIPYGEIPVLAGTEDMEVAANEMKQFKEKLLEKKGNKITIHSEIRMGIFFDELETVCNYIKPYVVVMGSQGTSAGERMLLGSHASFAMKRLSWPLITVPLGAKFLNIKKIAFACDCKNVVDTVPIDEIKTLLRDFNAELHVLNTGKKDEFDAGIVFQSGLFQEMLNGLVPEYHFINSKDIDEGILDFVEKQHIDLLIILPRRHSLLDKLIHRSHTTQLVLHSHVPVMALHQ